MLELPVVSEGGPGSTRCRRAVRACTWCAAGAVIVALSAYLLIARFTARPDWLASIDAENEKYRWRQPDPTLLNEEGIRIQARIWREILRRPMWDTQDIDELWAIYDEFDRQNPPEMTELERRTLRMKHSAILAIEDRIDLNAPMTDAARERVIGLLLEDLHHSWHFRRCEAAYILIEYKFIEDRTVRLAVERLLDDPHKDTAETVATMLANYDDAKSRRLALEERKRALQERKAKVKGAP